SSGGAGPSASHLRLRQRHRPPRRAGVDPSAGAEVGHFEATGKPGFRGAAMIGAAPNLRPAAAAGFDVERVRVDFPALHQMVHGKPLVYLDSAATSQKPQAVIDAVEHFYRSDNSNVHRGVHALSERATAAYEGGRVKVQRFLGAAKAREIVFVKGTTEGINLVAHSFVRPRLGQGDEILITAMEHHSNIVPWQLLCEEKGAKLKVAPITDSGELVLPELEALLGPRTRLLAVSHVSNALGTIN